MSSALDVDVGQRVRVVTASGSRRALLLCVQEDGSCDVEYEGAQEEEATVPLSSLTALLDFEDGNGGATTDEAPPAYAERCKAQGNALYKLHDPAAAAEQYTAGIKALKARLSTGGRCLVRPAEAGGTRVRSAMVMVLDEDEGTADLCYEAEPPLARPPEGLAEEGEEADVAAVEEEEDNVPVGRLIAIHGQRPALQCALTLNLARCSLQTQDWAAALARARRAEAIAAHDDAEPAATAALRRAALFVSARAALGLQRFSTAARLAARLQAAVPEDDEKAAAAVRRDARQLLREIDARAGEVRRSNKRLAQSVSQWVSQAMEQQQQQQEGAAPAHAAAPRSPDAPAAQPPALAGLRFDRGGAGTLAAAGAALAAAGIAASAAVAWGSTSTN